MSKTEQEAIDQAAEAIDVTQFDYSSENKGRVFKGVMGIRSIMMFKTFVENDSENPTINYHHMPMRGLYELTRLVTAMQERLQQVCCPVLLLQGTEDPVVVPASIDNLVKSLTAADVEAHRIESTLHGLVYSNIGDTWEKIISFAQRLKSVS